MWFACFVEDIVIPEGLLKEVSLYMDTFTLWRPSGQKYSFMNIVIALFLLLPLQFWFELFEILSTPNNQILYNSKKVIM